MPKIFIALLFIAAAAVFAACSADASSGYQIPEATPVGFDLSGCQGPDATFGFEMGAFLEDPAQGVRAAHAYRSPDDPFIWFIAADVEGPGNEGPGPIPIWWTKSDFADRFVVPSYARFNSTADLFSNVDFDALFYYPPEVLGELPDSVSGAAHVEECVLAYLRENPDDPVASELLRPGRWMFRALPDVPGLIVSINGRTGDCHVMAFEPVDESRSKWRASIGRDGSPVISNLLVNARLCGERLILDESLLPEIDLDSIPAEYRALMED